MELSEYFPVINFGFDENEFFDESSNLSVENTASEIIRSINNRLEYEPYSLNPYRYTPKRQARINRFLNQKITDNNGFKIKRREVTDVNLVCRQILDEIEQTSNHPVAQALAELYTQYDDLFDEQNIQLVVTEVIKATHPDKLREKILQYSNIWRIGKLAIH